MAVEIVHDRQKRVACLYCNTTDWAFGPIFTGPGCNEDAEDFLDWLCRRGPDVSDEIGQSLYGDGSDPRDYDDAGLERMHVRWQQAADKQRGVEA
jgi:hypothetical protein